MKKILCLMLAIASLFLICACKDGKDYEPIPSTEKEATTVFSFIIDKEKYDVKYELYRALFLTYSSEYDNGDKSFWDKQEAEAAKKDINDRIISFAADIYATLHHADMLGLDPYSSEADDKIYEYIKNSVDGSDAAVIEGFGGDYDAYLKSLYDANLNYSVQVLLLRYSIAYNSIITYYTGTEDIDAPTLDMTSGNLEYTKDDVYNFYMSDSAVRVSVIEINPLYISEERIKQIRDKIASFTSEEDALNYAVGNTSSDASDIKNGVIIGTESLDMAYYGDAVKAAFALDIYETSSPIKVYAESSSVYWILYRKAKSDSHFNECYEDIENVYIAQQIGQTLSEVKTSLIGSVSFASAFDTIIHSSVSMDEN